eukprot:6202323-Pleurochrysis_carterae.AAC.4
MSEPGRLLRQVGDELGLAKAGYVKKAEPRKEASAKKQGFKASDAMRRRVWWSWRTTISRFAVEVVAPLHDAGAPLQ